MRLLDQVAQCREPVLVSLPGSGIWELPGAATLAAAVAEAPVRYVLSDEVREACHEITARWPDLMDPGSPSLRLPVPSMWIEWTEVDAEGAARRNGMLVRAGDGDRNGTIHVFWEDSETGAEMAQAHIRFDLDRIITQPQASTPGLPPHPSLRHLSAHFLMIVEPEWLRFFAASGRGTQALNTIVAQCAVQALPNFPFLIGFLRLVAVRRNIAETHVSRGDLNRARARRGKPPLLDHVEVSLAVGAAACAASGHGGLRAPCRRHVVRGHLVNRHGTVFWRQAHLRGHAGGAGSPIKRNVRVSVSPAFAPRRDMWPEMVAAE
jgi:hypothetical protein